MDMRFDFYTSFSDRQVIGKNCSDFGGHAWLIAFINFGGNWLITGSW